MNNYIEKQLDYEEKEKRIRYICCVFLSLEALLICLGIIIISSFEFSYNHIELKYRMIRPGEVAAVLTMTAIACSIAVVSVVLSLKYKGFYFFYECIHILLGVLLLLFYLPLVFEECAFIYVFIYVSTVFIVFFLRFILYNRAKKNNPKKIDSLETTDTDE